MDSARWRLITEMFGEALDVPEPDREAFLDRACAHDQELRAGVDALLASHARAGDFLDHPVVDAGVPSPSPDRNIGCVLGVYAIDEKIGHGGMGTVYRAHRADGQFEQRVAVKMLRGGPDTDALARRFVHERQFLASLEHPNIARLFDGGSTSDGLPYLVMELVDGVPIDRYADAHRLTTDQRVRLCLPVIDAVQHAHDRQIVHRDLKPGNVLVTAAGHPKLLDFGIARLQDAGDTSATMTAFGQALTPDYASPEQVRGEPVTAASDVYSMGLLLYELLTGRRAYRLTSRAPDEIVRVVCEQEPEPPSTAVLRPATITSPDGTTATRTAEDVSATHGGTTTRLRRQLAAGLDAIVLRALRKDPRFRYPSMRALGDDLRRYLDQEPVHAAEGAWRYRAARVWRTRRSAMLTAALVVVTAGVTVALVRVQRPAPTPAAETAPVSAPRRSVAVASFRNLSAQPADAWLSTALAEMLATELGGGGQVRVVPQEVVAEAERDVRGARADEAGEATLTALRRAVGTDYLVAGSFVASGRGTGRALRLDVRLVGADASGGAVAESGADDDLFALVSTVGRALRQRLGVAEPSAAVTSGVRAALPASLEATRLYAEGLSRLRELDGVSAREHLERAAALEPGNPLVQAALATAWNLLGYDGRAVEAATRAFEASAGVNREERLNIEGRLREAQKDWPGAIAAYRTLWGFFSDNAEYGLRLASVQVAGGEADDALITVNDLRALPAPQRGDPRIDLAEAQAAAALSDLTRAVEAAERAERRAAAEGRLLLRGRALHAQGRSLWDQGRPADVVRVSEQARQIFKASGDTAGLAAVANLLGRVSKDVGDTLRAEQLQHEALAASERIGDRRGMSMALNSLGILLKDQGRLAEARDAYERSLALRREIDDRVLTGMALGNLGVLLFEQDRLRDAVVRLNEALGVQRAVGNKRQIVANMHNLGVVQRESGLLTAALAGFQASLAVRKELNDRRGGVMARVEIGAVQLAQGKIREAAATQADALALAREIALTDGEAQALMQLGETALARGDLAAAREHHESALRIRQSRKDGRTIAESQLALAALAIEEGRPQAAERLARAAEQSAPEQPVTRAHARLLLSRARLTAGDLSTARRAADEAAALASNTERAWLRWLIDMGEARLALASNDVAAVRLRLGPVLGRLREAGMGLAALDTRLLLGEAGLASGDPAAADDLRRLADEAGAAGAGLVRSKALAAGAKPVS